MADIIDIRGRLGRRIPEDAPREDGGTIYRVRLCGPDLHWVGAAGGILGRAFVLERFYIAFEDPEPSSGGQALLALRAGRELITENGIGRTPGLVVAASGISLAASDLRGADDKTLLLAPEVEEPGALKKRLGFPGSVVALPIAARVPEPLGLAVACVGGAARLVGTIRWTALEQALREELSVFDHAVVHRHLSIALEAFDRTALWAGRVTVAAEEVE